MQMDNLFPERSKRRTFTWTFTIYLNEEHLKDVCVCIYGFLTFKKVEIIEKTDARTHTTSILNYNSIRAIFLGAKFNNTLRNNLKPLFGVNFSKNSIKQLDYSLSISMRW